MFFIKFEDPGSWESLGINREVIRNLRHFAYFRPRSHQVKIIKEITQGGNVVATTGKASGKTLAYGVPAIETVLKCPASGREASYAYKSPTVLVILPTTETARQVYDFLHKMTVGTDVIVRLTYEQHDENVSIKELRSGCDIVVATPERLHHFLQLGHVTLVLTKTIVFDEADHLLSLADLNMRSLIHGISCRMIYGQRIFSSATFDIEWDSIIEWFTKYSNQPTFSRITNGRNEYMKVPVKVVEVTKSDKFRKLHKIMLPPGREPFKKTLVFVNSEADFQRMVLSYNKIFKIGFINKERSQLVRDKIMTDFENDVFRLLISTNISSRGVPIEGLERVVIFDIPNYQTGGIQEILHQIGRCSREVKGEAILFHPPGNPGNIGFAGELVEFLRSINSEVPSLLG